MEYFNEAAYKAWYRQYLVNLSSFINQLDVLRLRANNLPELHDELEASLRVLYESIEKITPRDFSDAAKPLSGPEIFAENIKVVINLLAGLIGKPEPFPGVYKEERDRIQNLHKELNLKEKIADLKKKIDEAEATRTQGSMVVPETKIT